MITESPVSSNKTQFTSWLAKAASSVNQEATDKQAKKTCEAIANVGKSVRTVWPPEVWSCNDDHRVHRASEQSCETIANAGKTCEDGLAT